MGKAANFRYRISEFKMSLNIFKAIREMKKVLHEEQMWQDKKRKSYFRRLLENLWWYLKNKEVCIYYNSYGFDIKGFRNKKEYLPYRKFRIERFKDDYPSNFYESRLFILRNKVVFALFFAGYLGESFVPKSLALLNANGTIFDFESKKTIENPLVYFKSKNTPLFVKKINGECGEDCYLVRSDDDAKKLINNGKKSSFLIQNVVPQHEDVNAINPSCINTVRIITIVGKQSHEPYVFAKYMRVGCNSINDNRATGGVGVAIDDNGVMLKYGVGHHRIETAHSITGYVYEGTTIPYWKELNELVINAHKAILEIPTIGWDVAITPSGPVLIEGNDNWEISGAQDTFGGLKKKWYELRKK